MRNFRKEEDGIWAAIFAFQMLFLFTVACGVIAWQHIYILAFVLEIVGIGYCIFLHRKMHIARFKAEPDVH